MYQGTFLNKGNEYILWGGNSDKSLKRGLLLKERICSHGEQILSFQNRPIFRRDDVQGSKQAVTKVVSLVNMAENQPSVLVLLNLVHEQLRHGYLIFAKL